MLYTTNLVNGNHNNMGSAPGELPGTKLYLNMTQSTLIKNSNTKGVDSINAKVFRGHSGSLFGMPIIENGPTLQNAAFSSLHTRKFSH